MNTTTVLSHEIIQSVMRRTHVCTSMHGAFKSANPLRPSVSVCTSQRGNLWLAYTDTPTWSDAKSIRTDNRNKVIGTKVIITPAPAIGCARPARLSEHPLLIL